jgi:hypothetical protein
MTVPDYVAAVRACPRVLLHDKTPAFVINQYKGGIRVVPEWIFDSGSTLADLAERSTIDDLRAYKWVVASAVSPVGGDA